MQSRLHTLRLLALAALAASLPLLPGCSAPAGRAFPGNVISRVHEVDVPSLPVILPDTETPVRSRSGQGEPQAPSSSLVVRSTSLGSALRLESVTVRVGDRVDAGQVLATIEPGALDAYVLAAKATHRRAHAQADLVRERRADVTEARDDLVDQRAQLVDTISELEDMRSQLQSQLSQARAAYARIRQMQQSPPQPPSPTTPTPMPPGGASPPPIPDVRQLLAGIARLEAALRQLDAGLARARTGLTRLDDARSTVADAQGQLADAARLSDIAVDAAAVGVSLAESMRDLAVVRSPVAGVVLEVPHAGQVLAPGAPLARVRHDGPALVELWLATEQIGEFGMGDEVEISLDSLPQERFAGRVTRGAETAAFPPTSMATQIIHMLRAGRLEVTLETSAALPAGTPVDVVRTNR